MTATPLTTAKLALLRSQLAVPGRVLSISDDTVRGLLASYDRAVAEIARLKGELAGIAPSAKVLPFPPPDSAA